MITKEEAYNKVKNYLDKNIKYSSIDNINNIKFTSKDEMIYPISYGKYKGKRINYYAIYYGEIWGIEERNGNSNSCRNRSVTLYYYSTWISGYRILFVKRHLLRDVFFILFRYSH
ncbi:hypothetical protein ACV0BM_010785 [Elizabethkingia meningoseptica]